MGKTVVVDVLMVVVLVVGVFLCAWVVWAWSGGER
jgi:hypothetical protein